MNNHAALLWELLGHDSVEGHSLSQEVSLVKNAGWISDSVIQENQ
jgi:hypothetical protein